MKTKKQTAMKNLVYLFIGLFFFTNAYAQPGRMNKGRQNKMQCMALTMPKEDMNNKEKQDLLDMALEEKMAYDFYYTMYNKWNIPMFNRRMNAKMHHKNRLVQMIEKYELTNPVNDQEIGKYKNSRIQKLYNELLNKGQKSLKDALIAAANLEEMDIVALKKAIDNTDNADLRLVYKNLTRGSEHHLKATVNMLFRLYDYKYEPQYLDKKTFDEIIASSKQNMQRRNFRN